MPRERDRETNAVLKVAPLCVGDEPFHLHPLVMQQQPGKRFGEPRIQLVDR